MPLVGLYKWFIVLHLPINRYYRSDITVIESRKYPVFNCSKSSSLYRASRRIVWTFVTPSRWVICTPCLYMPTSPPNHSFFRSFWHKALWQNARNITAAQQMMLPACNEGQHSVCAMHTVHANATSNVCGTTGPCAHNLNPNPMRQSINVFCTKCLKIWPFKIVLYATKHILSNCLCELVLKVAPWHS